MLFLGPNLTLYRNAPDKRKGCFLEACGFFGLWKVCWSRPWAREKEREVLGWRGRASCSQRWTQKCMSVQEAELWPRTLKTERERGSQRNGGLFCRWKLIWAMSTKCSAIPHQCKISLIHMPLIELSQLSGICGPLGKASATFYVCATFKIRWG